MLPKPDAYEFCTRVQASQFCSELPLLHSILSVVFQFHGNTAEATHLSKTSAICSAPAAQWPEVLLTARVSMPPNHMEVPKEERKIYGSTEQKFLAGGKPKSD